MPCAGRILLFTLLLSGCQQDKTKTLAPADAAPATSTTLYLDPPQLDLGEVDGSKPIQATLLLRNISDQATMVGSVQSSCGCTNVHLETALLPPQGFSPLHVTIDPFAKRGKVDKLVTITDQSGAITRSTITMQVRPSPHAMGKGKSLFAGKCAACHATPARGLRQGKALYDAVCAMCHGSNGRGGYAPTIRDKSADTLSAIITHGAGNPAMPAFGRKHGGPLSTAQIRALTSWLSHGAH
ncbi:MAG: c-type cytochrome [Mariprofundales bacterium]